MANSLTCQPVPASLASRTVHAAHTAPDPWATGLRLLMTAVLTAWFCVVAVTFGWVALAAPVYFGPNADAIAGGCWFLIADCAFLLALLLGRQS